MSLYGVMRTGVSGMSAQSNKLSTVSDNIANVNTTGYKRAETEFSSLILKSGTGNYDSGAVETHVRYAITDAGHEQFTTSTTDLAVQGNGFFMVSDATNTQQYLTRAGSFVPDSQGNLVNAAGFYLLGYPGAVSNISSNSTAGMQIVNVNLATLQATPSTLATVTGNLDPSAAVIAGPPTPASYSAKSSIVAYDNIGRPVTLDVYMSRTATTAGLDTWQVQVYDSATNTALAGGLGTFNFDTTAAGKGALVGPPTSLTVTVPGGSAFTVDLTAMTQVASSFNFKATVNGNAPSAVEKVDIDSKGAVNAILQNGTQIQIYTLPLADVPSPDNLTPEVGNVYSVSLNSGNLQIGSAGTGGLGTIQSGALEESNVDLADELTSMIEAQRGFTANSKSFQTGADLLDVVVNLKR
ncbi:MULTISPECIES: flagellar hook protein FlgE [unclassified Bradyrhizobium]|uniref:flagellar hook protein FlgE n=1 Tax=unclassified Bradyrhizobium TaxID=2631580 RepID=UPI0004050F87|nr:MULTISPECIES: flagellar hook protein FlgE [unclassified Bradyrhizobium]MCP3464116.1 flagellar hook protein FlgE [Bradyrhizobium sp. CCGUVB23]